MRLITTLPVCQPKMLVRSAPCAKITRPFSTSHSLRLRSSELTGTLLSSLKADPSRLWSDIHHTAQWGQANRYGPGPLETGLSRLSLSSHDKQARDWFVATTRSLSCDVHTDQVGNIFAVRRGLSDTRGVSARPTFTGSHLDSQPLGGRFDGVLGVCAGVEMLRVLDENHIETEGPVGVVNWTNEEGARFPVSMMGSGVWGGARELQAAYDLRDVEGTATAAAATVHDELVRIGYAGDTPARWDTGVGMGGYFELHIEQGPTLERSGEKIGAVRGVQAYKWFEVVVQGRACHTGTTGFADRADALYWASKIVTEVRDIAEGCGGLASVGIIRSEPQSVNTVPEKVFFTVDLRHTVDSGLGMMVDVLKSYLEEIDKEVRSKGSVPVTFDLKETFHSPATQFDEEAIRCVEETAQGLVGTDSQGKLRMRRMFSGAGHDAVNTSMRCPTAMIFVPCRDGASHHPREWTEEEDCGIGASVLLQSLLRYDQIRHERGDFE